MQTDVISDSGALVLSTPVVWFMALAAATAIAAVAIALAMIITVTVRVNTRSLG